MTKKILITGGAGYIGSMLSTLLVKEIDLIDFFTNALKTAEASVDSQ